MRPHFLALVALLVACEASGDLAGEPSPEVLVDQVVVDGDVRAGEVLVDQVVVDVGDVVVESAAITAGEVQAGAVQAGEVLVDQVVVDVAPQIVSAGLGLDAGSAELLDTGESAELGAAWADQVAGACPGAVVEWATAWRGGTAGSGRVVALVTCP